METYSRTTLRQRYKFLISTPFILVVLSLMFPTEGFLFQARPQVILNTIMLRSQDENQHGRDPLEEKVQTPLRGYQGGMIRPVVNKSGELSSDLIRVDGQDTTLNEKDSRNLEAPRSPRCITQTNMFRPSGMFRPSVVRANNDRSASNPVSVFLDELKDVGYAPGGKDGERTDTGAAVTAKRLLNEKEQVEAALESDGLEMESSSEFETEVYAKNKSEEAMERKIEHIVKSSKDEIGEAEVKKMADNERQTNAPITIKKAEAKTEEDKKRDETGTRENPKSKSEEEMSPLGSLEKKELKTKDDTEANRNVKPIPIDLSKIEEAEKLKDIQVMIQQRKAQQIELDKMDEELLRKTNEMKKRKEELTRMKDEFADAERKIRMNSNKSGKIRPSVTKRLTPHYSPKEYSALSVEEKLKLKADRAALSIIQDEVDAMYDDVSNNEASRKNTVHPILGPVIADLGYKRIHLVSSGRLGTIPIWKKQRTYRFDRVKRMAADKAKSMHLGFPGIICLHEDAKGKLSIIDGQHRVGMMQALRQSRNRLKKKRVKADGQGEKEIISMKEEKYFQNVLVEVYSELSIEDATHTTKKGHDYSKQIFSEINKAQPITLIDIQNLHRTK